MLKWFRKCTSKTLGRIVENVGCYLIFMILLISCTGPSQKNAASDSSSYTDDIPQAAEKERRDPETHIVEIKQMKFEPNEVKVRKGDRVLWINKDITDHDVTEQANRTWASSPLKTGQSWSMVVTQNVDYYCNLHQVMKGKITVEVDP